MKFKLEIEYNDERDYHFTIKELENCEVVHSGSSYLRIKQNGLQVGTIGSIKFQPIEEDIINGYYDHIQIMVNKKE